jgi:hypothetical protein
MKTNFTVKLWLQNDEVSSLGCYIMRTIVIYTAVVWRMFSNYSLQILVIKWVVVALLNVSHLFYWNIIFQRNPQEHWFISLVLAYVLKFLCNKNLAVAFTIIHYGHFNFLNIVESGISQMLQGLKIVKQTSYDSFHIRTIHNLINRSKKKIK